MVQAYMAVKENKMSIRKAAQAFGIPRRILMDRLDGKIHIDVLKSGTTPLFTEEQVVLFGNHLETVAEIGYGYSRQETIHLATD